MRVEVAPRTLAVPRRAFGSRGIEAPSRAVDNKGLRELGKAVRPADLRQREAEREPEAAGAGRGGGGRGVERHRPGGVVAEGGGGEEGGAWDWRVIERKDGGGGERQRGAGFGCSKREPGFAGVVRVGSVWFGAERGEDDAKRGGQRQVGRAGAERIG